MSFWQNIKSNLSLKRIVGLEKTKPYKHDFVDIERARTVGIIVNMNQCSREDQDALMKYIRTLLKEAKAVTVIEINFDKKAVPQFNTEVPSIFINPAKINWLDYPEQAIESQIRRHEFDILLNFDASERMTSKYVCGMAKVKTRAGMYVDGLESCYELMLTPDSKRVREMIPQFDHFLQMLEK